MDYHKSNILNNNNNTMSTASPSPSPISPGAVATAADSPTRRALRPAWSMQPHIQRTPSFKRRQQQQQLQEQQQRQQAVEAQIQALPSGPESDAGPASPPRSAGPQQQSNVFFPPATAGPAAPATSTATTLISSSSSAQAAESRVPNGSAGAQQPLHLKASEPRPAATAETPTLERRGSVKQQTSGLERLERRNSVKQMGGLERRNSVKQVGLERRNSVKQQVAQQAQAQAALAAAQATAQAAQLQNTATSEYELVCKVMLLGDSGVGKTCLLVRFRDGHFLCGNFISTVGVDFRNKVVTVDGVKVKLQIWDTAGQERFRSVTHAYYRDAHGSVFSALSPALLLLYDVTNKTSFDNIRAWLGEIREYAQDDVVIMLLGNKADCGPDRVVRREDGERLAREYSVTFMETSAKTGLNVEVAFMAVARELKSRKSGNADESRFNVQDYVREQTQRGTCPPCSS